jgi:hypothetical protein
MDRSVWKHNSRLIETAQIVRFGCSPMKKVVRELGLELSDTVMRRVNTLSLIGSSISRGISHLSRSFPNQKSLAFGTILPTAARTTTPNVTHAYLPIGGTSEIQPGRILYSAIILSITMFPYAGRNTPVSWQET